MNYLQTWFFIDLLSIIPLDEVIKKFTELGRQGNAILQNDTKSSNGVGNVNIMMRTLRIGRMYKLLRLMRLVKFLKILKNRENLQALFSKKLQINAG